MWNEMKEILAPVYEMFSLQCFNRDDSIENLFVKMKAELHNKRDIYQQIEDIIVTTWI